MKHISLKRHPYGNKKRDIDEIYELENRHHSSLLKRLGWSTPYNEVSKDQTKKEPAKKAPAKKAPAKKEPAKKEPAKKATKTKKD